MDESLRGELLALLPRLRRYAYALTGSADAGDDLVQDTYERAIRNIASWRPGSRLDSWMFRIARNTHLNNARATRVRREHAADIAVDDHFDGARSAEARMTLQAIRRFVWRLPEEQRSVLYLVCVEGLSYREVGDLLDLPGGTIASRLARARLALAEFLDGETDTSSRATGGAISGGGERRRADCQR